MWTSHYTVYATDLAGISISVLFAGGLLPGVVLAVMIALLARYRSKEVAVGLKRAPMSVVGKTLLVDVYP